LLSLSRGISSERWDLRVQRLSNRRARVSSMAALVAREPLAAPAVATGASRGPLRGVETHSFCARFADYGAVFLTQAGGVGAVIVADGAAMATRMGPRENPLADLLARKLSEAVGGRVVLTLAVRGLETLDDVRTLVALFHAAR